MKQKLLAIAAALAALASGTVVFINYESGSIDRVLENIGVLVIPNQIALSRAHEAFEPGGALKDPKQEASVRRLGAELVEIMKKLV